MAWILDRILPRYPKLDCLILMVGGSNVIRWLQAGAPPEVGPENRAADDVFQVNPEQRFGWTPGTPALRRILAGVNRQVRRPVKIRERAGKSYAELRRRRQGAAHLIDTQPDPTPMVEHFGLHLGRAIETARAHLGRDLRILVVKQPWINRELTEEEHAQVWNFSVGNPYLKETTTYYSIAVARELMRAIDQRAGEVAEELDVEVLDVKSVMDGGARDYFDFIHYTSAGSIKLAECLLAPLLNAPREREVMEEESLA